MTGKNSMKRISTSIISLAILLLLCGCSDNNVVKESTWNTPDGYAQERSLTIEYLDADWNDGIYKMTDHQTETWFCRISIPAWASTVSTEVKSEDIWHTNQLRLVDTTRYGSGPDNFFQECIQKGSDQMVIIGITDVSCTPILEMGYTIPYVLEDTMDARKPFGDMVRGTWEAFETLNGNDPILYAGRLSSYYNIIQAKHGEQFSFAYYSGTDYVQDTCSANFFYYIIGDYNSFVSLPVTKTQNGYFIVDYSELEAGYYCFSFENTHTIIQVK